MKTLKIFIFLTFFILPAGSASARISREDFAFLNTYKINEEEVKTVEESSFKLQAGAGIEPELQNAINNSLGKAFDYILARQSPEGSWKDIVDSATNYTSNYIMLMHYLEKINHEKEKKAAQYILSQQTREGVWTSFPGGPADKSLTLMNYFALKLAGVDPGSSAMVKARYFLEKNLQLGDIAGWDLFALVFMGQLPLSIIGGPYPKELIFLPDFLPNFKDLPTVPRIAVIPALILVQDGSVFHSAEKESLSDLSLFKTLNRKTADSSLLDDSPVRKNSGFSKLVEAVRVLKQEAAALNPSAADQPFADNSFNSIHSWYADGSIFEVNPVRKNRELLKLARAIREKSPAAWCLLAADVMSPDYTLFEYIKKIPEKSGLFYANSQLTVFYLAALKNIDCSRHPLISCIEVEALMSHGMQGLEALAVEDAEHLFMPLVKSEIWDTANLLGHLQAYNPFHEDITDNLNNGIIFLLDRQSLIASEWKRHNPFGVPGGWGFEDHNVRQPDPDDTSIVLNVLRPHILSDRVIRDSFQRGANWLLSMKNDDGGFPMFERQGDGIFNLTPIVSDLSPVDAMYDESQPEMSSRIATVMIHGLGFTSRDYEIKKIAALILAKRSGTLDGMLWESIWFTNYIFATAAVNRFLALAGEDVTARIYKDTNTWINSKQHTDGGWGESPASFYGEGYVDFPYSSPLVTSAVISSKIDQLLKSDMSDYAAEFPVIKKGLEFLIASQNEEGFWEEPTFVNSYVPREKLHCNYGLSTKLAPYDGLLNGLKFLNSIKD
jgi:squalene cyclase